MRTERFQLSCDETLLYCPQYQIMYSRAFLQLQTYYEPQSHTRRLNVGHVMLTSRGVKCSKWPDSDISSEICTVLHIFTPNDISPDKIWQWSTNQDHPLWLIIINQCIWQHKSVSHTHCGVSRQWSACRSAGAISWRVRRASWSSWRPSVSPSFCTSANIMHSNEHCKKLHDNKLWKHMFLHCFNSSVIKSSAFKYIAI